MFSASSHFIVLDLHVSCVNSFDCPFFVYRNYMVNRGIKIRETIQLTKLSRFVEIHMCVHIDHICILLWQNVIHKGSILMTFYYLFLFHRCCRGVGVWNVFDFDQNVLYSIYIRLCCLWAHYYIMCIGIWKKSKILVQFLLLLCYGYIVCIYMPPTKKSTAHRNVPSRFEHLPKSIQYLCFLFTFWLHTCSNIYSRGGQHFEDTGYRGKF